MYQGVQQARKACRNNQSAVMYRVSGSIRARN